MYNPNYYNFILLTNKGSIMKKVLFIILVFCMLAGGGFYSWKKYNKDNRIHSEELFWQGRNALESNDDANAFKLLNEAVTQSPDNAEFNLWAGISAKKLGKNDLAYSLFQKSWDIGKKEPIVFLNMIATSSLPKKQRMQTFESMAREIPNEQERLELTAILKYNKGELKAAEKLLKELTKKYPEGIYAEFYAQVLLRLKKPEAALKMLEKIHQEGKMNTSCYIILSKLYFAIDEINKAHNLFNETQKKGMDSAEVTEQYGEALFLYGNDDKSTETLNTVKLTKIFNPSDILSPKIFINKIKDNSEISKLFSETTTPEFQSLIKNNTNTLNRFDNQRFLELACRALNKFCMQDNWYSPKLIPSGAEKSISNINKDSNKLTPQELFTRNAELLITAFPNSLKKPEFSKITHNARIILMIIESAKASNSKIKELLLLANGSRRWLEGERYFGKYLLETLNPNPNKAKADEYFNIASELLSNNDIILLNRANNLASKGKYQDAMVLYNKLKSSNLIIARSPAFKFIRSQALLDSGELIAGKRLLIKLLKRGYITEPLLSELGQVAIKLNDSETTRIVLEIIQKNAIKHPNLYLLSSKIILQKGNSQEAEAELGKLLKSNTDKDLKKIALTEKARIQLLNNNNEKALSTIDNITNPTPDTIVLKAEILSKLGKNQEAVKLFESFKKIPLPAKKLYAKILASLGKLAKAEKELNDLLKTNPNDSEVLLNLALILSATNRGAEALKTAQNAVDINPNNIKANAILSQLLLTNGKAKDAANLAIKILSLAPKNEVALILLPSAYNITKNYIKAIESSNNALKILKDNSFVIIQKAVALVELSKEVDRANMRIKHSQNDSDFQASKEDETKDEVAALTSDIVFSGARSDIENTVDTPEDTSLKEFLAGRTSSDLREEAIKLLAKIQDQPTAKILMLETELLQKKDNKVVNALKNDNLTIRELFTFGIIAENMGKWHIASIAYMQASILQPANPIILNNYANAIVKAKRHVDPQTRERLTQISRDLPQILNGDMKAINTSAAVFDYLNDWDNIIKLAKTYPLAFKQDSKLNQILLTARSELKKNEENNKNEKTPASNIQNKLNQDANPVETPEENAKVKDNLL